MTESTPKDALSDLSLYIQKLRERSCLSIRELAKKSAVSPAATSRVCEGKFRTSHPKTLRKLAKAFAREITELSEDEIYREMF